MDERVPLMPSKKLRDHLGLSQSQFAKWLGAGLRTVQHWEQGRGMKASTRKGLLALLFIAQKGLMAEFKGWIKKQENKND